jgi:cytoskeletal protein CcmA (bactofilin family)
VSRLINKEKGLSLFETLLSVSVTLILLSSFLYFYLQHQKEQQAVVFGKDMVSIVTAFDKRIHVDGFDVGNFKNGTEWSNANTFIEMLNTEFIAKNTSCGTTKSWVPVLETEKNTQLIPCNFWSQIPYGFNVRAKINTDTTGYVKNFTVTFQPKSTDDFAKNFRFYNKAKMTANSNDSLNITGGHHFYFATLADPANRVSVTQCLALKADCVLVASYDREGGYEYLRVDGSNSMLNSTVTFKESKNSSKQQCFKWSKSTAGAWTNSQVDCGIGIYTKTGYPLSVDVAVKDTTQNRIMLDKECGVYGRNNNLVEEKSKSPCGILRTDSGTDIYQVVDITSAKTGYIQTLYTSSIISNDINTQYETVMKDLTVNGKTFLNDTLTVNATLNVSGDINGKSNVNINGTGTFGGNVNAVGAITANQNITSVAGNINATSGTVNALNGQFSNNVTTNSLTVNGTSNLQGTTNINSTANLKGTTNVTGRLNINEYLSINKSVTANTGCASVGLVARNTLGQLLTCQGGIWKLQYAPIYIITTKSAIDNTPGGSPTQNCLQQAGGDTAGVGYWLSCGSRFCITRGYAGGMLQELSCTAPGCNATAICF